MKRGGYIEVYVRFIYEIVPYIRNVTTPAECSSYKCRVLYNQHKSAGLIDTQGQ